VAIRSELHGKHAPDITMRLRSIGISAAFLASASHAGARDKDQKGPDVEPEPSFDGAPLEVTRQTQEYGIAVSSIRSRNASTDPWSDGLDVMLTSGLSPRVPWLRVSGFRGVVFRAFDSKSYSFTPYYQGLEGGLGVGVIELAASIGLSPLSIDVAHTRWSVGFLQPRTSALVGLRFRNFHLRGVIYSEYYWRWFGRDSALVQGVGIQLIVGSPNH